MEKMRVVKLFINSFLKTNGNFSLISANLKKKGKNL